MKIIGTYIVAEWLRNGMDSYISYFEVYKCSKNLVFKYFRKKTNGHFEQITEEEFNKFCKNVQS